MSKQLTAVEWLEKELISIGIYVGEDIYKQAKEMEREQIMASWDNAVIDSTYGGKYKRFEQYYNETYGSKD